MRRNSFSFCRMRSEWADSLGSISFSMARTSGVDRVPPQIE